MLVNVDHFKMRQVLRNLISNAIKFTPNQGTITVQVKTFQNQQFSTKHHNVNNGFVRIEIKDSGVGITPENQLKLFKEVIQFDAKKNQSGGGSGLGLWLSQRLVTLNHGVIGVYSEGLGKGSTFFIDLPLEKVTQQVKANPSSSTSTLLQCTEESNISILKSTRLLVVDDSSLSRKMVARLLKNDFLDVVEAKDGVEAIAKYQASLAEGNPFQVILMDNQMSNMDGLQCATELRKLHYKGALVGLTGYGEKEQVDTFISHGADHVMVKPLDYSKLLRLAAGIHYNITNI
jgi:CheY-like chemotaxis protein